MNGKNNTRDRATDRLAHTEDGIMYSFEQALEDARFFEKNVNQCQEYEDAWIFQNTKKRWGTYNPVVIYKGDGEATPYFMYEPTRLMRVFKIDKNGVGLLRDVVATEENRSIEERNSSMTKEELTQIRETLSLTKKEFAEKIGVKPMLLGRYESGGCKIPDAVAIAAKALVEPVEEDASVLIKQIRESLSLSKSALAKLIGVSGTAIGNYESGKSKPKDEILSKIKELVKEEAGPAAPVDEKVEAAIDEKKEESAPVDEEQAAAAPIEEEKKPTSIVIESKMGGTITTEEILSRLPDGCDTVYVKPEENAAYWVKGAESGVINLW